MRAAAASSRLPLDNEGFASILSFLASPDVGATRLSSRKLNLIGRTAAGRCASLTGAEGEHCVLALRAAAPLGALVDVDEDDDDDDDPEGGGVGVDSEGKEAAGDAAERRAQAFAHLRKRMRALGAGCVERCAKLLAPHAARGIEEWRRVMVATGHTQRLVQRFPAVALSPPTRERYLRGGDPCDPDEDDLDQEEGAVAAAAPISDALVRVRRTPAEARVEALRALPTALTEAEAVARTESRAVADSEAADAALYGAPHLGGRVALSVGSDSVDLTIDMSITPDELLQLAQAPAVVRAQQVHRDDRWHALADRRYANHVVVADVLHVLGPSREQLDGVVREVYIPTAPAQALTREAAARAVPALRALLLALAPYVVHVYLRGSDTDSDGQPHAHATLLRDERYPVDVAIVVPLAEFQRRPFLVEEDAPTATLERLAAAARTAATERRLAVLLPALAAAAPDMVRKWISFSGPTSPLADQ